MAPTREPDTPPAWARWALVAITVAAAALRLPGLTAEEPWFDEAFSIVLASQDPGELWRRALADQTNPPGFYLLLWGWTRLGGFGLAWMRLLPTLCAVATVPVVAMAARAARRDWTAAVAAAAFAAVSPLLLAMSSELRAYAPVALAMALVLLAAAHGRRALTAVGLVAVVMLHYFGAFAAFAVAAGLLRASRGLMGDRLRTAVLTVLPAAIALGAWLLAVVAAGGNRPFAANAEWIRPRYLQDLVSFASQVVGTFGTPLGGLAVLALLLVALGVALRETLPGPRDPLAADPEAVPGARLGAPLRLVVVSAYLPLLLVPFAGTLTGRPLWVARYLIITLPAWWILLGSLVARAPQRWRTAVLVGSLGWAVLTGVLAEAARPRRTRWSAIARAMTAGGPRAICVNEDYVALPLRYQAVTQQLPLTVLDLGACRPERGPDAILIRPGTERALEGLRREGVRIGLARDLGTTLPETALHALEWPLR